MGENYGDIKSSDGKLLAYWYETSEGYVINFNTKDTSNYKNIVSCFLLSIEGSEKNEKGL